MRYYVTLGESEHAVDITPRASGGHRVEVGGQLVEADAVVVGDVLSIRLGGRMLDLVLEGAPPEVGVIGGGHRVYARVESERARALAAASRSRGPGGGEATVTSPMPGRVMKVLVAVGDEVAVGQSLVVVEAMKMENEIKATKPGKVAEVFAQAGATVEAGAKLVRLG